MNDRGGGYEGLDRQAGVRLTLLTLLVLALIGVLIVFTGLQAVSAERRFFRDLTFDANSSVARMVAREFTQVFSNTTGLIEDMAGFPMVRTGDLASTQYLFDLMLRRHAMIRTLYLMDPAGAVKVVRHGKGTRNAREWRQLSKPEFDKLSGGSNYVLSAEPYFVNPEAKESSSLAVTYAVRLEDPQVKGKFAGVLGGELDLDFIPDILAAVQVGHTGQCLVAAKGQDGKARIIFSSRNLDSADSRDFLDNFPLERAYSTDHAGFEYAGQRPKMASFARIHTVALEPGDRYFGRSPFPVAVTPGRIPDWIIVVQQHAVEGYSVADRMKWNIAVLVVVGLVGLGIIAKLWFDSLTT